MLTFASIIQHYQDQHTVCALSQDHLDQSNKQLCVLREELAPLQDSLSAAEQEAAAAEAQLEELKRKVGVAQAKAATVRAQIQDLKTREQAAYMDVCRHQAGLRQAREELANLQAQLLKEALTAPVTAATNPTPTPAPPTPVVPPASEASSKATLSRPSPSQPPAGYVCHTCHQPGHFRADCTHNPTLGKRKQPAPPPVLSKTERYVVDTIVAFLAGTCPSERLWRALDQTAWLWRENKDGTTYVELPSNLFPELYSEYPSLPAACVLLRTDLPDPGSDSALVHTNSTHHCGKDTLFMCPVCLAKMYEETTHKKLISRPEQAGTRPNKVSRSGRPIKPARNTMATPSTIEPTPLPPGYMLLSDMARSDCVLLVGQRWCWRQHILDDDFTLDQLAACMSDSIPGWLQHLQSHAGFEEWSSEDFRDCDLVPDVFRVSNMINVWVTANQVPLQGNSWLCGPEKEFYRQLYNMLVQIVALQKGKEPCPITESPLTPEVLEAMLQTCK
jgi:hypothetical protein